MHFFIKNKHDKTECYRDEENDILKAWNCDRILAAVFVELQNQSH